MNNDILLDIKNLRKYYPITSGLFSQHVGDVKAQIDRTMEVVEGILAARHMSLADTSRAVAYFKSAKDVAVFSKWLERRGVNHLPLLNVCCDICRSDLLFELELDALRSLNSVSPVTKASHFVTSG